MKCEGITQPCMSSCTWRIHQAQCKGREGRRLKGRGTEGVQVTWLAVRECNGLPYEEGGDAPDTGHMTRTKHMLCILAVRLCRLRACHCIMMASVTRAVAQVEKSAWSE